MTLIFQTKTTDWLVRCEMDHAEKETEAVDGGIQGESRQGNAQGGEDDRAISSRI